MQISVQTDAGHRYELNEDLAVFDDERSVWIVADGMGGHPAGEVASEIAGKRVMSAVADGSNLPDAYLDAHRAIIEVANEDKERAGMGTTVVGVALNGPSAAVSWVGDSRAYLWRNKQLRQVTHDHSFMQLLIDDNRITPEEARTHPQRNVVTQVLGVGDPKPETVNLSLRPDDWLLLCTDGLNDELTDAEIAAILGKGLDFSELAPVLVQAACDAGGRDNVTVMVLAPEVDAPEEEDVDTVETPAVEANVAPEGAGAQPGAQAVGEGKTKQRSRLPAVGWWVLAAAVLVSVWYLWGG